MSISTPTPHDQLDHLPDTVYLVNEELQNQQIKFHIYVEGTYTTHNRYAHRKPDTYHKPRCGQDGRKQYDTDNLIEVPTTQLATHLLPGLCRRCLNHLDLPQPETEIWGADIFIDNDTIVLVGGDTKHRIPSTTPTETPNTHTHN